MRCSGRRNPLRSAPVQGRQRIDQILVVALPFVPDGFDALQHLADRVNHSEQARRNFRIEREPYYFSSNRLSRFSPTCATDSSFENPRNPQAPLMVWMVRKTLASVSRLAGSFSSRTNSRSSKSRFSLLSTRNSPDDVVAHSKSRSLDGKTRAHPGHSRHTSSQSRRIITIPSVQIAFSCPGAEQSKTNH